MGPIYPLWELYCHHGPSPPPHIGTQWSPTAIQQYISRLLSLSLNLRSSCLIAPECWDYRFVC